VALLFVLGTDCLSQPISPDGVDVDMGQYDFNSLSSSLEASVPVT